MGSGRSVCRRRSVHVFARGRAPATPQGPAPTLDALHARLDKAAEVGPAEGGDLANATCTPIRSSATRRAGPRRSSRSNSASWATRCRTGVATPAWCAPERAASPGPVVCAPRRHGRAAGDGRNRRPVQFTERAIQWPRGRRHARVRARRAHGHPDGGRRGPGGTEGRPAPARSSSCSSLPKRVRLRARMAAPN